jgi:hypothetical protein
MVYYSFLAVFDWMTPSTFFSSFINRHPVIDLRHEDLQSMRPILAHNLPTFLTIWTASSSLSHSAYDSRQLLEQLEQLRRQRQF